MQHGSICYQDISSNDSIHVMESRPVKQSNRCISTNSLVPDRYAFLQFSLIIKVLKIAR